MVVEDADLRLGAADIEDAWSLLVCFETHQSSGTSVVFLCIFLTFATVLCLSRVFLRNRG